MSATIKIATVDRTSKVDWRSLNLNRAITNQIDTLTFDIKRKTGADYKPALNDDIELFDDAAKIFGGKIVEMDETVDAARLETVSVLCKDHSFEFDRKRVVKVYETPAFTTYGAVVNDIIANFTSGFTNTGVNSPVPFNYMRFNYEQPTKCLQQLAEQIGYDWWIDADKVVHFKAKFIETSPFNLTDTNGKYYFDSLKIRKSLKNLRNTIFVRGGEFKGASFTEVLVADGTEKVFKQGYRYSAIPPATSIVVKKGGVTQSVGTDNIHDPTAFDVLYNFAEKAVKFRDDNKPAASVTVEVTGLPHIPVIIRTRDNTSVAQFGEHEHKIIDKSINSKDGARDRAAQEIIQWASTINEGEFITKESGLDAGQKINIQSTLRNIDTNYVISRITTKMKSPSDFVHHVVLMSTQVFGMVEFLQNLLIQKDKEIQINENEVLDRIETAMETVVITEAFVVSIAHNAQLESIGASELFTVQALNYPVEFVYAPFPVPTGFKREGNFDGAVYG